MSSWRDRILHHFDEPLLRLYLVSDPDDLLLDEELLTQLQNRGLTRSPMRTRSPFVTGMSPFAGSGCRIVPRTFSSG